jgi:integrase
VPKKKPTTKTINNYLAILRPALTEARYQNLIHTNPLLEIKPIKGKKSKAKESIDPFTYSERNAILKACTPQLHNMIKFAFWTGIRPSELCVLKWNDILKPTPACPLGRVNINKSKPRKATKLKKPKTKSGKRKIIIFPDAYYALERQKDYTYLLREYIFHNPNTNEPWKVDKILEHWKVWCKKAGVTYRSPYQLRHTYATLMFMGNENAKWLSKQMGHSSPIQTLDLYGDWLDEDSPDSGMKAVAKFSKFGDFSNISSNIISQPL